MDTLPPALSFHPPLLNSANPWATTLEDLQALYACESIGAVTTRTALIKGFEHDDAKHKYIFFGTRDLVSSSDAGANHTASLNSLGYSPITLQEYLSFIKQIRLRHADSADKGLGKGFIVSVTGTAIEVADCYKLIAAAQAELDGCPLAVEVNLSCPNIPNKPPPAYSKDALVQYVDRLRHIIDATPDLPRIPFGLKTPPFTHSTEYEALIGSLEESAREGVCPVSFLTATNTLGSCMVFSSSSDPFTPALPGAGIGGMAGAPLRKPRPLLVTRQVETEGADCIRPTSARKRGYVAANARRTVREARPHPTYWRRWSLR
jgi:dihydroorotate dehydrogenase (fumarate)